MKKVLIIVGAMVLLGLVYVGYIFLTTRNHSPQDTATYTQEAFEAQIVYCQPYKKGRAIFGPENQDVLVPYGVKWRTGANEATTLSLNETVWMGSDKKEVAPGQYSLYTIPGAESWTVVVNSRVDYWGAGMSDPFQEEFDVVRVQAPAATLDSTAEQFHIQWTEKDSATVDLQLFWDQTLVTLPVYMKP